MEYTQGEWKITQPKSATLSILSADNQPIALLQLSVPPYDDQFEKACKEMLGNANLIAAAPDTYRANIALDFAIGSAIMELAKGTSLAKVVNDYIWPAQLLSRKATAKAEGKTA